jgi:hypothetical protein
MTRLIASCLMTATGAISALCSLTPGVARADQNQGWYVGVGAGEYNAGYHDSGYNSFSYQVFGGWRFSPYVALEASYLDLGRDNYYGAINGTEGFAPWVVGTLPVWKPPSSIFDSIELFAKAGEYFWRYDAQIYGAFDHYYNDFVYGGGVGTVLSNGVEIRGEFDRMNLPYTDAANAWFVTLGYRF